MTDTVRNDREKTGAITFQMVIFDRLGNMKRDDRIYYNTTPGRTHYQRTLEWALHEGFTISIVPERSKS